MTRTALTVVASHAAVRDTAGAALPRAELFERLAAWALMCGSAQAPLSVQVRDDLAGLLACAQALTRGDALMPRIAREADHLRTALLQGKSSAHHAAQAFSDAKDDLGQRAELHALFVALAEADARLKSAGRIDRAGALLRALALLESGERPRFLAPYHTLVFAHIDEPTHLELALVTALAHPTLHVRVVLPLDPFDRGLLGPSQATAAALEKRFDVEHLSVEFVEYVPSKRA